MENKRMWEIKQRADAPDALELYIYGDVENDHHDWWTGEIIESQTSADFFRKELATHADATQIDIYINSYGGSVFEGTAIYNQLKRHSAHKTVHVDGFACSIASVIAMAGDEIIMPRNALMMVHNMWMYACGNSAELRKAADDLDKINQAGREAYLQRAGDKLTAEKLAELEDGETWLTAAECIEYGLADKYADTDADMTKASEVMQKMSLNVQQRIKYHQSIAAQLRQLVAPPEPPKQKEPQQPPKQENTKPSMMQIMAGL